MKDLILEGAPIARYNGKDMTSKIHASATSKTIEVKGWQGFSDEQMAQLQAWIVDYGQHSEELLTFTNYFSKITTQGGTTPIPTGESNIEKAILQVCPLFNFISLGSTYVPTMVGSMADDYIKISGESYYSYTAELFFPIFNWVERYLSLKKPHKARLEFWLTYFNTSTSRRITDLIALFSHHPNTTVHWYYEHNDINGRESGEEFQEHFHAINFTLHAIDKMHDHPMNKPY